MSRLKGFGKFWYDFVIGDDWKIAAAVVIGLLLQFGGLLAGLPTAVLTVGTGVLMLLLFTAAVLIDVRGQS